MAMTISVVTTKGGSGKSTLAALLAGEIAQLGQDVVILDADPQQTLVKWAARCRDHAAEAPRVTVLACPDERRFQSELERASEGDRIVLIDVQGAASNSLTVAALASDLVVAPCVPSEFDAAEVGKIPRLLKAMAVKGRQMTPYRVVINAVDGIEQKSTPFRNVIFSLADQGIVLAETIVLKRSWYRRLAEGYGSLYLMRSKDDSLVRAIHNIKVLTEELLNAASSQAPYPTQPADYSVSPEGSAR